ncbi:glycohydrolase toxin TNT-related protein [Prauserella alba]|uniref:TNT domain-containing protein n=1 Tax=Prauserella alba TaxID=176898 RepID=A0ABN1VFZ2_9PSEU
MALPTQLNATEQDTLVKQIGLSLLRAAPRDWRRVTAVYRAVGRYHELTGEVVTADGTTQEWVATHDIATLFGKLRAGMYREGRGTWFNARYQLDHPSSYNLEYDRDEPSWDLAPPSQAYADELRMFPRSEENVPDWLMRRMAGLGPERSGPRFRMARIFDGAGPNGPVVTRPELDPDERDRVLAYLDGAPTVGPARGYDVDRLAPDQSAEVPIAFHSDGSWIWPAAVPYYLRTHGVAPEADLLQHIRATGFTVPEVPDETRQAAAAHVAHGQGPQQAPQQGPPRVPGADLPGADAAQPTTQTPPVAPERVQPPDSQSPDSQPSESWLSESQHSESQRQDQAGHAADAPAEPAVGSDDSTGTGAIAAGAAGIAGVGAAGLAGAAGARNGAEFGDAPVRPDPVDPDAPELPVRRPGKAAQELDEQFSGINGTDHASRMSPVSPFTPADGDDAGTGTDEDAVAGGSGAISPETVVPETAVPGTAASGTAPPQPDADDYVDPEAETASYTLPGRGDETGPAGRDDLSSDDAPMSAPAGGYDVDEPFGGASQSEPLHEQGTAFTPIPTFGDEARPGRDTGATPDDPARAEAGAGDAAAGDTDFDRTPGGVDDDPADFGAAAPGRAEPDFDSGPPTTITSPVRADGPPPADPNRDEATPPLEDRPAATHGPTGPQQDRHPGQEPPAELDEERTAPTPRQDFDQPEPPTASGTTGAAALGTAGALGVAGAAAAGFAGRDDTGEYDDAPAPDDRVPGDRGGYDLRGHGDEDYGDRDYGSRDFENQHYGDRRDFGDPRGFDDSRGYGDRHDVPDRGGDVDDRDGRSSAVEPDPGPPTQIGNMPPQDPELDDLQDKLDELEVPDEYYALGVPSDYGWSLERVSDGWRVGWYDGELKSTAVFGDAADAKAFMLGKVLLSPDGVDEVPEQPAHGDPEFEQVAPEPPDAGSSRPLLATLTPEIATGTRQVSEEPFAQTRTVSPADDPASRGGPVPQAAPAPVREPVAQQAAATQHRPAAGEPQQAARPQAGQGGQQPGGQQWPIQPLPGEPPLTLFRGKEMRTLPVGSELDRFGGANGNLTYAAGTPFEERSLVPEWVNRPYHVYRVQRPLETLAGVAIPWFNQPGGGAAYMLPASIEELLADGDIIELEPGEPPVD